MTNRIIEINRCIQCPNFRPAGYGINPRPECTQNPEHVYEDNWHTDIPDSCPLTSVTPSQEKPQAKIQPELEAEQFEPEISQGKSTHELENRVAASAASNPEAYLELENKVLQKARSATIAKPDPSLADASFNDKLAYGLGFFDMATEAVLWAAGVPMESVRDVAGEMHKHNYVILSLDTAADD